MCNAKSIRKTRDELNGLFKDIDIAFPDFEPRYRVGPRQHHPIVLPDFETDMGRWDLVPPGNAKPFLRTNARSDALTSKWPWKMLVGSNRCIVPADGFYEPEKPALSKEKVPWSFYEKKDSSVFWMAGLFTRADEVTYTIITTDANSVLRVHDRMPVMLNLQEALRWLQEEEPPLELLRPSDPDEMHGWRVSDEAKSSKGRDHPGLIEPIEAQPDLL